MKQHAEEIRTCISENSGVHDDCLYNFPKSGPMASDDLAFSLDPCRRTCIFSSHVTSSADDSSNVKSAAEGRQTLGMEMILRSRVLG
jgi:hypothetical protein